ncbi:aminotransferase class IV [Paracrocinitomix mangrovi]|uniref:aminotransferase class IV n=1 Tax=Paracrocinitomix mangrovi TaxID=2862509 RepID=UPI001C8E64A5|nr:aminotransferase class IV [Paracrocinitomix mangrovi]UKN02966.1 aminotransferase class IV [Paracrocinitomix mangrovi]
MSGFVNFNGSLLPADKYSIMAGNRAYLYGDGLFETIRVINGKAINLDNHYMRLSEGMEALQMKPPANYSASFFEEQINELVEQNNIEQGGRVRLSVDRKPGGNFLPNSSHVDYYIEAYHHDENRFVLNDRGYKIDLYDEIKKDISPLAKYKTKNALIYIMAKLSSQEKGVDDLLIQNYKMGIIEGGSSNLFVVSNGVLYTPGLDLGPLAGTMRMQIINIALQNGIKVYECNISPQNLLVADEVFLTNAIQGVIWVDSYRTKHYGKEMAKNLTSLLNDQWI